MKNGLLSPRALAVLVAGTLGVLWRSADAAEAVPERVSRQPSALVAARAGAGPSFPGSFSGDGRFVVFSSAAPDLFAIDPNGGGWDVFRRDLVAGRTELVSALDGRDPSVSHDGSVTAFVTRRSISAALPGVIDTNSAAEVMVRRSNAGGPECVSVRPDGLATGNGGSQAPEVSADGRWVVFESLAADLVAGFDENATTDVFLRDLAGGTTLRLSSKAGDGTAGNGRSFQPRIGGSDASVVVFQSAATDLVARPDGNVTDLYVWTRATGSLRRVVLPGATVISSTEFVQVANVVLSADGRYAAFRSATSGSPTAVDGVWVVDLSNDAATRIGETRDGTAVNGADDSTGPVMSADGRVVAFEVNVGSATSPRRQVQVWRPETGTRTLDSESATNSAAPAEPVTSETPVLDPAGTRLAFLTTNAVPGTDVVASGPRRLFVRNLATGETAAVPSGALSDSGELPGAAFQPNGTWILFGSALPLASDVVDDNQAGDVFLAQAGALAPLAVSVADAATPHVSPAGGAGLAPAGISADGRFVLVATSVAAGSTRVRQVYRVDRANGVLALASHDPLGGPGSGASTPLSLSPDGRYAAFLSAATNLVAGDTNNVEDVFRADFDTGTVVLAGAKDNGDGFGARGAAKLALAEANPRYAVFAGSGLDWVAGMVGRGNGTNAFLRDFETHRTYWLSRDEAADGTTGPQDWVRRVAMSDSGRWTAFLASRTPGPGTVYVYDRLTESRRKVPVTSVQDFALNEARDAIVVVGASAGTAMLLQPLGGGNVVELLRFPGGAAVWNLAFSADGRALVFVMASPLPEALTGVNDTNGLRDVFRYDFASGKVTLCSVDAAGRSAGMQSDLAGISGDGSRVVFRSAPVSRPPGANSSVGEAGSRVRWFDVATGKVEDVGPPGELAYSTLPVISRDGRRLAFLSTAEAWGSGDGNGLADVFAGSLEADAPGGDTDGDALPDAWELEHFGSLAAGASDDPDSDGATNVQEYQSGTDPVNAKSLLRAVARVAANGDVVVGWDSVVGILYTVEETEVLEPARWTAVSVGEVPGDGTARTVAVPATGATRFLRVRVRRGG